MHWSFEMFYNVLWSSCMTYSFLKFTQPNKIKTNNYGVMFFKSDTSEWITSAFLPQHCSHRVHGKSYADRIDTIRAESLRYRGDILTQRALHNVCCLLTICLSVCSLSSFLPLCASLLSVCVLCVFLVKGRENGGSLSCHWIGWAGRLCQSARPAGRTARSRNPPW